ESRLAWHRWGSDRAPGRASAVPRSVRHEDRQGRVAEDVTGGAAEDHLPQTALRIGALDEQVAAERGGAFQNDFAGGARAGVDGHRLGLDAVAAQMARGVLARRPAHA